MTEDKAQYDVSLGIKPDKPEKFCPFSSGLTPGPLGKLTFHRPPCDPKNCALAYHPTQDPPCCSLLALAERLAEISCNIEHQ